VREVWCGADEALASLDATARADETDFLFPPAVLDACLQVALAAPQESGPHARDFSLYLPAQLKSFRLYAPASDAAWCHAQSQPRGSRSIVVRLTVYDTIGNIVAIADGLRARRMESTLSSGAPLLEMRAELQPHPRAETPIDAAAEPRTWLLLHDRDPIATALADRLAAAGHHVIQSPPTAPLPDEPPDDIVHIVSTSRDREDLRAAINDTCISALTLPHTLPPTPPPPPQPHPP